MKLFFHFQRVSIRKTIKALMLWQVSWPRELIQLLSRVLYQYLNYWQLIIIHRYFFALFFVFWAFCNLSLFFCLTSGDFQSNTLFEQRLNYFHGEIHHESSFQDVFKVWQNGRSALRKIFISLYKKFFYWANLNIYLQVWRKICNKNCAF